MKKKSVIASTLLIPICSTSLGNVTDLEGYYIVKEGESFSKIAEKLKSIYNRIQLMYICIYAGRRDFTET